MTRIPNAFVAVRPELLASLLLKAGREIAELERHGRTRSAMYRQRLDFREFLLQAAREQAGMGVAR